ncbi:MAG: hypothetical protein DRN05_00690 [Thermoplasmata archaeon]|nr:MAG: hypothetical protein DRN05_00690 [Thermoplasmata archaeon]
MINIIHNKFKLVMFDMDGTLLKKRTIFVFAEKKGFYNDLLRIVNSNKISYLKSIEIAKLLRGMDSRELLEIFRDIPLQKNVKIIISELRRRKIKTAIVTNSYQFVADDLKKRLNIDYAFANNLIIDKNIVTGKLIANNRDLTEKNDECKIHSICKSCVMDKLCKKLGITPGEVIAVGDGEIDICMLRKAGIGIAFNAPEKVQKNADIITNDLKIILKLIQS